MQAPHRHKLNNLGNFLQKKHNICASKTQHTHSGFSPVNPEYGRQGDLGTWAWGVWPVGLASWISNQCSCAGPWTQDLMFYHGHLKVLNNFISELMFRKWSLMGQQSMHQGLDTSIPSDRFSAVCTPPLSSGHASPGIGRLMVGCVCFTDTVKVYTWNCEQPLCLRTYNTKQGIKNTTTGQERETAEEEKKSFFLLFEQGAPLPTNYVTSSGNRHL